MKMDETRTSEESRDRGRKAIETNAPLKELCEKVDALRAKALDADGSILDIGDDSKDNGDGDGSVVHRIGRWWKRLVDSDWVFEARAVLREGVYGGHAIVRGEKSRLFDQSE